MQIDFKVALIVLKCLHEMAPLYLAREQLYGAADVRRGRSRRVHYWQFVRLPVLLLALQSFLVERSKYSNYLKQTYRYG